MPTNTPAPPSRLTAIGATSDKPRLKTTNDVHRPESALDLNEPCLLPHWPKDVHGIPNICLRSALFGLVERGKRRAVKGEKIAAVKGVDIRYTGWQLDQGDFDVLGQALHLQAQQPGIAPGSYLQFTAKSFLTAIGRQPGKSAREWLKDSFRRLTATALEVDIEIKRTIMSESYSYVGSLIDEFYYQERQHTYLLRINPKLRELFAAGWTQLHRQQRHRLKTDLAKWLHGFLSSHKYPYPIKVATLKHLCGSRCARISDFRFKLTLALQELKTAEVIAAWTIDAEDKVQLQQSDNVRGHSGRNGGA